MVSSIFLSNEQAQGYCLAGLKHTKNPTGITKHSIKALWSLGWSSHIFKTLKGKEQARAGILLTAAINQALNRKINKQTITQETLKV